MATLVLTVVGTALGGPLGGLIGATLGSNIDRALFAPSFENEQVGPRLDDLAIQTSAYGTPIARVYGQTRIAGSVIWSTGLQETREETTQSSGGKGGPSQTTRQVTYRYSTSVAIALSNRPIFGIGRIWADGKAFRLEDGSFTANCQFRFHNGGEAQAPDSLIEAVEGLGETPAHRGLAYMVLENLELEEFANRLPNLSIEVIGDEGSVSILTIAGDLIAKAMGDGQGITHIDPGGVLTGIAISGQESVAAVLTGIQDYFPFNICEREQGLGLIPAINESAQSITENDWASHPTTSDRPPRYQLIRDAAGPRTERIALQYRDPTRDYQSSVQRAGIIHRGGYEQELQSGLTLSANQARELARAHLRRRRAESGRYRLSLPLTFVGLEPGDRLSLPDPIIADLVVEQVQVVEGIVEVQAKAAKLVAQTTELDADAGRFRPRIPAGPGETSFHIVELPTATQGQGEAAVYVAGAGTGAGWRGGQLFVALSGTNEFAGFLSLAGPAVMGTADTVLPAQSAFLWDDQSNLEITLIQEDMVIDSKSEEAILGGANQILIGDEVVQAATAIRIGPGRYRLSRLLRGRKGTEAAISGHVAGERVVLLASAGVQQAAIATERLNVPLDVRLVPSGGAFDDEEDQLVTLVGRSLLPLAPVHVTGQRNPAGDLTISWIRQNRVDPTWRDYVDAPLGEGVEQYEVTVLTAINGAILRQELISVTGWTYAAASQIADHGALPSAVVIEIRQISQVIGPGDAWSGIV